MSKRSPRHEFLIRHRNRLSDRVFVLGMFGRVLNPPTVEVDAATMKAVRDGSAMELDREPPLISNGREKDAAVAGDVIAVESGDERLRAGIESVTAGIMHICIFGPPGAGKSTLAEEVAEETGRPIIHLDDYVEMDEQGNWTKVPRNELLKIMEEAGQPSIIEGVDLWELNREDLLAHEIRFIREDRETLVSRLMNRDARKTRSIAIEDDAESINAKVDRCLPLADAFAKLHGVSVEDEKGVYTREAIEPERAGMTLTMLADDVPIVGWNERMTIGPDDIANYSGDPVETTAGRFVVNEVLLVQPLPERAGIPYMNREVRPGDIGQVVAEAVIDKRVEAKFVYRMIDYAMFLSSLSPLAVTTATRKSFTTDKRVEKRREELLREHEGELNDPEVSGEIERELMEMDDEFLGDDPSRDFYDAMGKSAYQLHRKKMFLTNGGMRSFSEDASEFEFIGRPLNKGIDAENFDTVVNELRFGSYQRGKSTQDGGMLNKYMQLVFQNISVDQRDCGTKRGRPTPITADNLEEYVGRWYVNQGGKVVRIERDSTDLVGRTVRMRSPMYCEAKPNLCFRCMGDVVELMDQRSFSMIAGRVTTAFLNAAMKGMHDSSIKTFDIDMDTSLVGA